MRYHLTMKMYFKVTITKNPMQICLDSSGLAVELLLLLFIFLSTRVTLWSYPLLPHRLLNRTFVIGAHPLRQPGLLIRLLSLRPSVPQLCTPPYLVCLALLFIDRRDAVSPVARFVFLTGQLESFKSNL